MAILQKRIKQRRQELGYTLAEIAEFLNVKEATAQRYESGEIKNIKHETIYQLSKILKCDPSYLMGWTDTICKSTKDSVGIDKLTTRQLHIIELFNLLTDSQQDNIIGRAEILAEQNEENQNQENIG